MKPGKKSYSPCSYNFEDKEDEEETVEEDDHPVMVTARKKGSTDKLEKAGYRDPEVIKSRFDRQDILRNIAAAANHFGFSNNEDLQLARIQIAAILYMSGLSDADTIFDALNKDAVSYAEVNRLVNMYSGEMLDEKIILMDMEKDIDDTARKELKMLTDWELEYLSGHSHKEPELFQLIHSLFADAMGN